METSVNKQQTNSYFKKTKQNKIRTRCCEAEVVVNTQQAGGHRSGVAGAAADVVEPNNDASPGNSRIQHQGEGER